MATAISSAANGAEHLRHDRRGDAVFAGVLDAALHERRSGRTARQRQRAQINKVARDIERDHHAGAERQRERKIAAGIFHFAGGKRNVVPGVGGEERSDLRNRQHGERRDQHVPPTPPPTSCRAPRPELFQKFAPKFAAMACAFRPRKIPKNNQAEQRRNFRGGEDVLDESARLHAENVDDRERDHDQDGDEVLRVQANIHAAQNHGADGKLRHFPEVDDPMTGGDCRPEDAEEFAESDAHGGDRARLNHEKQSPTVEKAPERAERLAQINVLPAGARHHGGQFAIGERGDNGEKAGDDPGANEQRGRGDLARNFGGDNEDARADHGAHHQHGRAGQAETFDEVLILMGVALPIAVVRSDVRMRELGVERSCSRGSRFL